MIILRTLLENQLSQNKVLRAEPGLSFLVEADEARLTETMKILKGMGVTLAGFNHCTGAEAQKRMGESEETAFYSHLKTGDCIFLP